MKNAQITKMASARHKSQAALERRERNDAAFLVERKRQEAVNKEKVARLKALRLTKEATEREHAATESDAKTRTAKSKKSGTSNSLLKHKP